MRFGAPRRLTALVLACGPALGALGAAGCSSATKQHYLHHLSIMVPPADEGSRLVAAFDADRGIGTSVTASGDDSFSFESR